MDKNEIRLILRDWNEWEQQQDIGIVRHTYLDKLESLIEGSNQVITITGPRRAGKSYLMRQMARRLSDKGVRKENLLFVANIKGIGSRNQRTDRPGFNSHDHLGSISIIPVPGNSELAEMTKKVYEIGRASCRERV